MDTLTFSVDAAAPASMVWEIWSDLESSTQWDTDVANCQLEGDFTPGTHGICKLKNGLQMSIIVEDMVVGHSWCNSARLLGANLYFNHWVEAITPQYCRITHQANVSQVSPWLWRKLITALLRPALASALNNLAKLAEQRTKDTKPKSMTYSSGGTTHSA